MIHLKLDINNGIDQEKTKVGVNAFQEKNDLVVDVVVGIRTGVSCFKIFRRSQKIA
ncbi:hypothetical protein [Gottfriedia acidiceleris]|uniref:hypothetical protein n=1 Tax=Gottfriedia acidiceleris TaxID=371036 RepID=UPI002FFDB57A